VAAGLVVGALWAVGGGSMTTLETTRLWLRRFAAGDPARLHAVGVHT
jgi:hypothetical protein